MNDTTSFLHGTGRQLYEECWNLYGRDVTPDVLDSLNVQLRKEGHSPDIVSSVLTQLQLRAQAHRKHGTYADSMFFTRQGLEQSTHYGVANYHAQRLRHAGVSSVADLGCGIGADACAFARAGLAVTAEEIAPVTASLAEHNLAFSSSARVVCQDVLQCDIPSLGVEAIFADPARRLHGTRIHDPERWLPPLSHVLSWQDHVCALGVKVSPAIDLSILPANCHATFISVARELVEASLWLGSACIEGPGRSAIIFDDTLTPHSVRVPHIRSAHDVLEPLPVAERVGTYIVEPDPALIRSGCLAWLADTYGLLPVGANIAYMTGDDVPCDQVFYERFEVLDSCRVRLKDIVRMLISHGVHCEAVKKRGVDISPSSLLAQIHKACKKSVCDNAQGATVIVTRVGTGRKAFLTVRK